MSVLGDDSRGGCSVRGRSRRCGDDESMMGRLHRGAGPPRRYPARPVDPSNLQLTIWDGPSDWPSWPVSWELPAARPSARAGLLPVQRAVIRALEGMGVAIRRPAVR